MPSLIDWTIETDVSCTVDSTQQHGGNSSYKLYMSLLGSGGIRRGNSQQSTVYIWIRKKADASRPKVDHISYGSFDLYTFFSIEVWTYFRCTFWYDSANNTRWGRIEKWVTDAWVQQGTDTNFGSGSPDFANIRIRNNNGEAGAINIDDIQVYEESV